MRSGRLYFIYFPPLPSTSVSPAPALPVTNLSPPQHLLFNVLIYLKFPEPVWRLESRLLVKLYTLTAALCGSAICLDNIKHQYNVRKHIFPTSHYYSEFVCIKDFSLVQNKHMTWGNVYLLNWYTNRNTAEVLKLVNAGIYRFNIVMQTDVNFLR